jgi:hypothetical protein
MMQPADPRTRDHLASDAVLATNSIWISPQKPMIRHPVFGPYERRSAISEQTRDWSLKITEDRTAYKIIYKQSFEA